MRPAVRPGDLYRFTGPVDTTFRLLAADEELLYYDAPGPNRAWMFGDPGRACSYYVTLTTHLDQMAEPIGHESLTDAERALYRPDLPLSLARSATLSWYDPLPDDDEQLLDVLTRAGVDPAQVGSTLPVSTIGLAAWTARGYVGRPVMIAAAGDGAPGLSVLELVRQAATLQSAVPGARSLASGTGLYRLGHRAGAPTYTIWGSTSRVAAAAAATDRLASGR